MKLGLYHVFYEYEKESETRKSSFSILAKIPTSTKELSDLVTEWTDGIEKMKDRPVYISNFVLVNTVEDKQND